MGVIEHMAVVVPIPSFVHGRAGCNQKHFLLPGNGNAGFYSVADVTNESRRDYYFEVILCAPTCHVHVQALDVSLKASCSRVSSCELRTERIMSVAAAAAVAKTVC